MTRPGVTIPPATIADTDPVHDTTWNAILNSISNLFTYLLGGFQTKKPYVMVHQSYDYYSKNPPPLGGPFLVRFDVEDEDTDNMWNPSTIFQIKINTSGVYELKGRYGITAADGSVWSCLLLNNPDPNSPSASYAIDTSGTVPNALSWGPVQGTTTFVTRKRRFVAGDYLEVAVAQAGATTTSLNWYLTPTWFSARWIGP